MKKIALLAIVVWLCVPFSYAGLLDTLKEQAGASGQGSAAGSVDVDNETAVSGLKEALAVSTEHTVAALSRVDGYYGNQLVKILMPEKIQTVANVLAKAGFQKQVDDFVLSMNRAAEKAAPEAASIFGDAIRQMSFQDAIGIVRGGGTAATDYFRTTTSDRIYAAFKPIISKSMNEAGVTRAYQDMMESIHRFRSCPRQQRLTSITMLPTRPWTGFSRRLASRKRRSEPIRRRE